MALCVSLAGTAVAVPIAEISLNKKEKRQIRKMANKIAQRVITKRAPGLSVASAQTAQSAESAKTADTAKFADTAKSADSADTADTVANGAITTAKLANDAVTKDKLAPNSVTSDALAALTQRSNTSGTIAAGTGGNVTASCNAGEQRLSGGNDGFTDVWVAASRASATGQGWTVFGFNDSAGNRTITSHAYCLAP